LGRSLFRVSVAAGDGTPILGDYAVKRHISGTAGLQFKPRFAFVPGTEYRAVFDSAESPGLPVLRAESRWRAPKSEVAPPAAIQRIYPTADRLPENLLRFYLHFTGPMNRGEGYDHIKLYDATGKAVVAPFLTLGEELWDESGKRLTLFIDPGRIKRGLKPREELGPVLESGKTFTLVVEAGWRDANGQALAADYRKSFHVEAPVERGIEIAEWKVEPPKSGSRDAVNVQFPRPLDHALLHRALGVIGEDGQPIAGTVAVSDTETRWSFVPRAAWTSGRYELVIERFLEDVAGNRPGRPFEVDEDSRPIDSEGPALRRAFEVR
jgi:hypothetical protein